MRSKGSLGNPLQNSVSLPGCMLKFPLLFGQDWVSPKSGQIRTCAAKTVMTFQCLSSY